MVLVSYQMNFIMIPIFVTMTKGVFAEMPLTSCSKNRPFKMTDSSCANYNEICMKTGDEDCQRLNDACKQCPPSNYTNLMLQAIIQMDVKLDKKNVDLKNELQQHIKNAFNKQTASQTAERQTNSALLGFLICLIIFGLLLILEMIFGCIGKLCRRWKGRKKYVPIIPNEDKESNKNSDKSSLDREFKNIIDYLQKFEKIMELRLLDMSDQLTSLSNTTGSLTKFEVTGVTKPVEIYVHDDDTGVKVKRKICSKCRNEIPYNYKIIKLKFEGKYIDENQFLIKSIGYRNVSVICEVDSTAKSRDSTVIKVNSNTRVPNLIQIRKDQTIAEFKRIFENLVSIDFSVFKARKELKDGQTIEQCELDDNDHVTLVTREKLEFKMHSIFDKRETTIAEFSNIDKVSTLKTNIASKYNTKPESIVIFCGNKYLQEETLIFENDIQEDSQLRFCCFQSLINIEIHNVAPIRGDFSEILPATDKTRNVDIMMKKYKFVANNNDRDLQPLLKELRIFNVTNLHPQFVKHLGVYKKDDYLYMGMEKMESSLKLLLERENITDENRIRKWSKQILNGLSHLHENGIIHRNIKPSNILLDDKDNAKISSFGLCKYVDEEGIDFALKDWPEKSKDTMRFMAPEIKTNYAVGVKADVWSVGAVVTEIATCRNERFNKEDDMEKRFAEFRDTDDEKSKELKDFIGSCLMSESEFRASITKLLNDEFLMKNEIS